MHWIVAVILLATPAAAQTVMDGSDRALPAAQRTTLNDALGLISTDPYHVELRRLRAAPGGVLCGEGNFPNTYGGHSGYARFYADRAARDGLADLPTMSQLHATIAPMIDAKCGRAN